MDLYPIAKLLHIASAIVWAGGIAGLLIVGAIDARTGAAGTLAAARRAALFARVVVGPAAIGALVFGGTMVYLAWSFLDLWILLALAGFLATFLVDALLIGRLERRLPGPDGVPSAEALMAAGRILRAVALTSSSWRASSS